MYKKMNSLTIEPCSGIVEAEAGVMLPTLSNCLAKNGLQGGEWAVGIPGTLGGAIYMNAGTGNLSLAKNLISVKVVDYKNYEIIDMDYLLVYVLKYLCRINEIHDLDH